ncbi:MAG: prolipoprotein diacylglyceryl transferase [Gammaproteobacteria bacterium]|nr:prolipoprotein diacylglyceryl transferase [Gammaproteobacteria bacterium]
MNYPDIDPVALSLGSVDIHWYGISYMVAFLVGWWLAKHRARQLHNWGMQAIDDLVFYVVLGVVLGGRLGYILFYGFDDWLDDPLRLIRVWEGGMSFHGGLVGVLIAMGLFARKHHKHFFEVTDFIAPIVPVGLFSGRIGNFINGELWGGPTDLPWGMSLSCDRFFYVCTNKLDLPAGIAMTPPLHPSQLYEAFLEGIIMFIVLWLVASKRPPMMTISGLFLIMYGLFRFSVELVRMPDAHIGYLWGDWLTMGQLLSLPMLIAGIIIYVLAFKMRQKPS